MIKNCDWLLKLINPVMDENGQIIEVENFVLKRQNGKTSHVTMIDSEAGDTKYRQPIIFEHGNLDKVGDIVIILRKNPKTHRWMVQAEKEDAYITEEKIEQITRATRSSLDNIQQAVDRKVVKVGDGFTNPRRIGGRRIFQHYVTLGWGPQKVEEMVDIFDYVQCPDSLGQAVLLKALQHMPHEVAYEILDQMRQPSEE